MSNEILYQTRALSKLLEKQSVETYIHNDLVTFTKEDQRISFCIAGENFDFETYNNQAVLHYDQLVREPEKIVALILSRLKLNTTVFARNCEIKNSNKTEAFDFLNTYHIMGATQSAFNRGLFYKEELVTLATFSKGRKMNRLEEDQRSFELIRFCSKPGITVTGGLTKLVKNFCEEKKAGDIMTYVDKQLSDGKSFINAGFKKYSETEPNYFLVNKTTYKRTAADKEEVFNGEQFYLSHNAGNIKLVYTPGE